MIGACDFGNVSLAAAVIVLLFASCNCDSYATAAGGSVPASWRLPRGAYSGQRLPLNRGLLRRPLDENLLLIVIPGRVKSGAASFTDGASPPCTALPSGEGGSSTSFSFGSVGHGQPALRDNRLLLAAVQPRSPPPGLLIRRSQSRRRVACFFDHIVPR